MAVTTTQRGRVQSRQLHTSLVLLIILVWMLCAEAPTLAQTEPVITKVTNFQGIQGVVGAMRATPDAQRVVYIAGHDTYDVNELFTVASSGGVATKLSGVMVPGGDVADFKISPDGDHVLFRADADTDDQIELFEVPITGGNITKLNSPMVPAGDVLEFSYSPDLLYVVYKANQRHFQTEDLYASRRATGSVVRLSSDLNVGSHIESFQISPDSMSVAYQATDPVDGFGLLASPLAGGSTTELPGGRLNEYYAFLPDGQSVVYEDADRQIQLGSIIDGTTTRLNPEGSNVVGSEKSILTASGGHLLTYLSSSEFNGFRLHSLPTDGSSPIELTSSQTGTRGFNLAPDQSLIYAVSSPSSELRKSAVDGGPFAVLSTSTPSEFEVTDDGQWIIYSGFLSGAYRLFTIPISGGPAIELNPPEVFDGVRSFKVSLDGTRVFYTSDHITADADELFSVPIGGGPSVRLNDPLIRYQRVRDYVAIPGGAAFVSNPAEFGLVELFSTDQLGGPTTRLNGPMMGRAGSVRDFHWVQDLGVVVFLADLATFGLIELWSYSFADGGDPIRLNEPLAAEGRIFSFEVSESLDRVVFYAETAENKFGVFSAPINGGAVTLLNEGLHEVEFGPKLSPDDNWLLYRADEESYLTPADGGPVQTIGATLQIEFSDDSQWLVFSRSDGDGVTRVYSVAVTGGPPNLLLDTPGNTGFSSISPDSSLVGLGHSDGSLGFVPINGGPATSLTLPEPGCHSLSFTTDMQRLLYTCGGGFFRNLYSSPISGGPPVQILAGTELGPSFEWKLRSDSQYVVARAYEAAGAFRIVGAPIDGSEAGQRFININGSLLSEVGSYIFSPDHSSLIYMVDFGGHTGFDLFSSPIGGDTRTQLNAVDEVTGFSLSPDQSRLFYLQAPPGQTGKSSVKEELISIPVGGGDALHHHPPFRTGQNVTGYQVSGDSSSVIYVADQSNEGVFDLYLSVVAIPLFADGFETGDLSAWD